MKSTLPVGKPLIEARLGLEGKTMLKEKAWDIAEIRPEGGGNTDGW